MRAIPEIVPPGMALRAADRTAWDLFVVGLTTHATGLAVALASTDPALLMRQQGYCAAIIDLAQMLGEIEKHHENLTNARKR